MDPEDLAPRKPAATLKLLDPMSIAELEGYIAELEAEILRVRAAIAAKQSQRGAAEAFFRR
ncbi:MAG: DUF1192 domain-containing protein [Alphaproteobacteria bacterium]|nr:DUF1192 domain-containing protein [Alphaproteobacteria bacterium]